MMTDTPHEYKPLDSDAYKVHARLLKCLHCAKPVFHKNRQRFVQCVLASQKGGAIEMIVYLAGNPAPIDANEITMEAA